MTMAPSSVDIYGNRDVIFQNDWDPSNCFKATDFWDPGLHLELLCMLATHFAARLGGL